MNNNLTPHQEQILAYIKEEFVNGNKPTPINSYGLLNVNAVNAELARVTKAKAELKANREAMDKVAHELAVQVTDRLNADFKLGNLPIFAKTWCNTIEIESQCGHDGVNDFGKDKSKVSFYHRVTIHTAYYSTKHEFGMWLDKVYFHINDQNQCCVSGTIEKVIASDYFQKRLFVLVEASTIAMKFK
jgi:hypothetical protein